MLVAAETKKQLGQFFTINSDYILSGLEKFIVDKDATDPFAGSGDLIIWAEKHGAKRVKGYDIDKRYIDNKTIFYNDSLKQPLNYKFVLTNPPYLNINKASQGIKMQYFEESGFEDLYHISLLSIFRSEEGIVIVPINFLSAENSKKIRDIFFSRFEIVEMNYFKHQVFPDTTYNVIAFYYKKKEDYFNDRFTIKTRVYPDNKVINIELKKDHDWIINGNFLKIINSQKNELGVYRLTEKDVARESGPVEISAAYNHVKNIGKIKVSDSLYKKISSNIILLKAIDSGSENGKIALEDIRKYGVHCLVSKRTSRHMVYFIFKNKIPITKQREIIDVFNKEINEMRQRYSSLFMTNYRDNGRKRISFDFVYKFINYIYFNKIDLAKSKRLLS